MKHAMTAVIPEVLQTILRQTPELKQAFLVGGCVRDALLGQPNKDYDIEVFGLNYEALVRVLSPWGKTDLVGRSFGVVKLTVPTGDIYDFTIPRRDSKVAPGHKGFAVQFDSSITPREAAARRDFTINALMYDPRTDEILDFFGGAADLNQGILRHTSAAFSEDPLRVLRGMQFAGRFNLAPDPETIQLCRTMKPAFLELANERVWDEWAKWAEKSLVPSAGLRFLAATAWWDHFPELKAMEGVPQESDWHPEGDVFVHTCHCCDALVKLPAWQAADAESKMVYSLAVLAHDFGKPLTTSYALKDGQQRIVSPGHEEAGGPIALEFLNRIHAPRAIQERVIPLVTHHLAHLNPVTDRSVRRLAKRLEPENIQGLGVVMTADHFGRPPKPWILPEGLVALQAKAAELQVQAKAPAPILMGRHLVELGMPPGPELGAILDQAFDAQLEGTFGELPQAYQWLIEKSQLPLPEVLKERLRQLTEKFARFCGGDDQAP